MGEVSFELLEKTRKARLVEIEAGLIKNVNESLIHSFQHLHGYSQSSLISDLKWAVISAVQAGELLSDVLLIRTNCPTDELFRLRKKTNIDVFFPLSLEGGLLELLEKYGSIDVSPIKITLAELNLLQNVKALATVRNELMHRTIIDLADLGHYARAALSILVVFEYRCHKVEFPEIDSIYGLDSEVTFLMSWMRGEASDYFKQAIAYLESVNAPRESYANCPNCGGYFISTDICCVCRAKLVSEECSHCGHEWYELREEDHLDFKCPDCGK